jgi:hypothetical protein
MLDNMAVFDGPALFINEGTNKATTFDVHIENPPNWDALQLNSMVKVVKVHGRNRSNTNIAVLQIALLMQSHPRMTSLVFEDCRIEDLDSIIVAAKGRHDPVISLEFNDCKLCNWVGWSLRFMLQSNCLRELICRECEYADEIENVINVGMSKNESLERLDCILNKNSTTSTKLSGSVMQMLEVNHKISIIKLDVNNERLWKLSCAACCNATLQSLEICRLEVHQQSIGALVVMWQDIASLKELTFNACVFDRQSIEFLVARLSKSVALETLSFVNIKVSPAETPCCSFANLQVQRLEMGNLNVGPVSKWINEVADNQVIQHLDIRSALSSDEDFEIVCDVFLMQNRGPSKLAIGNVGSRASMVTAALRQNASVKDLSVGGFDAGVLLDFARGLVDMRGLCRLTIGYENESSNYTEEFFKALHQSLELNTTIQTLSLRDVAPDNDVFQSYLRKIRYLIALNRVGRNSMMTATVPVGIWAHVLARSSDEIDGIYFVLSGKPDILSSIRKRRSPDE